MPKRKRVCMAELEYVQLLNQYSLIIQKKIVFQQTNTKLVCIRFSTVC